MYYGPAAWYVCSSYKSSLSQSQSQPLFQISFKAFLIKFNRRIFIVAVICFMFYCLILLVLQFMWSYEHGYFCDVIVRGGRDSQSRISCHQMYTTGILQCHIATPMAEPRIQFNKECPFTWQHILPAFMMKSENLGMRRFFTHQTMERKKNTHAELMKKFTYIMLMQNWGRSFLSSHGDRGMYLLKFELRFIFNKLDG